MIIYLLLRQIIEHFRPIKAFLDFTFSDCKAGKDKKGSKAARKSVRKLGKKCKKFIKKL